MKGACAASYSKDRIIDCKRMLRRSLRNIKLQTLEVRFVLTQKESAIFYPRFDHTMVGSDRPALISYRLTTTSLALLYYHLPKYFGMFLRA